MTGYTKLFGSIIASTIWREDDKTRIVWITLLALSNKNGIVEASVPGLADLARVTVAEARAAIAKLEAPDPDSRSKESEGRRIIPTEGGWFLINHGKYREKLGIAERREYLKLKQREHRAKKKASTTCQQSFDGSTESTHAEAAPEAAPSPCVEPRAGSSTTRSYGGNRRRPKDLEECLSMAATVGLSDSDARSWFADMEAGNWSKVDGTPFGNWPREMSFHRDRLKGNNHANSKTAQTTHPKRPDRNGGTLNKATGQYSALVKMAGNADAQRPGT